MIYKNLMEIADNFDTFFFDAWGVFNIGGQISQSAIDVMRELVAAGKSVSILSNTPQRAAGAIESYGHKGITQGVNYLNMFTSGQVLVDDAMAGKVPVNGSKYYVAWDFTTGLPGGGESYDMFSGSEYIKVQDINDADFVYLDFPRVDGEFVVNPDLMIPEQDKIIATGKPVICANPDVFAIIGGTAFFMQGGASKRLAEHGVPVIYYGKPYPEVYLNAMCKLGDVNPARTLMIGDTLHTDVLGAARAGIKSCLTLAGGISARDIIAAGKELTAENINAAGEKIGAVPDYIIEKVPATDL